MRNKFHKAALFILISFVLLAAKTAGAQEYPPESLRSPATVRGVIGGESHYSYVIRVRKGQVMTVKISWRREHEDYLRNNHAEFWIKDRPNWEGDGYVKFGKESNNGKHWSGKIPKTGDCYIFVAAHPIAHYTLKVAVK